MAYIVDIQGFQYKDENFLCKEIAIIDMKNEQICHRIIKLPQPLWWLNSSVSKQMEWTTRNIHGLSWDSYNGNFLYYENISFLLNIVIKPNEVVYVKGLEKKNWLRKMISNEIVDLTEIGCPNFKTMYFYKGYKDFHCNQHIYNNLRCAKQNVLLLKNWFKTHVD